MKVIISGNKKGYEKGYETSLSPKKESYFVPFRPILSKYEISQSLPLRDFFRKFLINICFKTSEDQYLLGHK